MQGRSRWMWLGVSVAAVLAVGLRLFVLGVSCAGIPAADDECITVLQAKQIAQGSFPLLFLGQPYGFPLDAYLMAPIVNLLPRTALGARLMAFGFGLVSLALGLLILRRWGRLADIWPGVLLLLYGSTFLLILQSGSALPGYPTLILLSSAALWIVQRQAGEGARRPALMAFVAGLLAGVACSVTLLALPILVVTGVALGLNGGWRRGLRAAPVFVLGGLTGLLPYVLVAFLHPAAREISMQSQSWQTALKELWSPVLDRTLPAALGIGSPVIAGSSERVAPFKELSFGFGLLWISLLVAGSWTMLAAAWSRWRHERRLVLDPGALFVLISWLCLLLFVFSSRSHHRTYRYLLLAVWAFPFLVAYLYQNARGIRRGVLGAVTVLFVVVNLANTAAVLKRWSVPDFAVFLKSYDLRPALQYLEERGVRHAYATYADAYRITFATDERIVCAQPMNERFPGWPVPFKETVDASTNVAYVLSDTYRFPPKDFERDLKTMGVSFRKQACGRYQVFTDFTDMRSAANTSTGAVSGDGGAILQNLLTADASHNASEANRMTDEGSTFWRCSGYLQQTGMWVSVRWDGLRPVRGVLLHSGKSGGDYPESLYVDYLSNNGQWERLPDPIRGQRKCFEFYNLHPVYGDTITSVPFPRSLDARGLRLELAEPRLNRAWTIGEISVLTSAEPEDG